MIGELSFTTEQCGDELFVTQIRGVSKDKFFGNNLKICGDIYSIQVPDKYASPYNIKKRPTTVISDFKVCPAEFWYEIGNKKGHVVLDSLVQKKILLGRANVLSSEPAEGVINNIEFSNIIKLFDQIKIPVNLNLVEDRSIGLILPDTYLNGYLMNIIVRPFYNGFFINDKFVSDLTERSIIWGMCFDGGSISGDDLEDRYYYVKSPKDGENMYRMMFPKNTENMKLRKKMFTDILSNWEDPKYSNINIDTSGSLKNKSEIISYLLVGNGFIPVGSTHLRNLANLKYPSVFKYRDAIDFAEQRGQKINVSNKGRNKFLPDELENGIVTGYSDSFIEDCVERTKWSRWD